jgi:hypothetical protein
MDEIKELVLRIDDDRAGRLGDGRRRLDDLAIILRRDLSVFLGF